MSIIYLIYANITTSDSFAYYKTSANANDWLELFKTGSPFIRFLAWPFSNMLMLSYYSLMLIFSHIGFVGILLFYCCAKENINIINKKSKITILEWLFILPNIHFWSSSLGKGSVMIFGLGLFFYGLSRFNYRFFYILIGLFFIYFTRPHILLTCIIGIAIASMLSGNLISRFVKYFLIILSFCGVYFLTDKVLEFTDTDSLNILNSSSINHRAMELSKSSSGVDISTYNPVYKLITFWFRPLFVDATGFMGLIVSFENLLLVFMLLSSVKTLFTKIKHFNGLFLCCLFAFILGSFVLAQVSGNLGIALRQKAQLMPLFFILYAKCIEIKQQQLIYA
ncbi:MAG: hypothetical protein NTZ59_13070 [Bacteroidetes bacterium]|nr:hypothetical protein [Bacteroidota bacterium]